MRATSLMAGQRLKLSDIAVTMEERQTYISQATSAESSYQTVPLAVRAR